MNIRTKICTFSLLFLIWGTLTSSPIQAQVPNHDPDLLSHSTPAITPSNITRSFAELGLKFSMMVDQIGSYTESTEGIIDTPIPAGNYLVNLQCKFNATQQDLSFPIPTSGYLLAIKIGNQSLGTAIYKPSVTQPISETVSSISSFLTNVPPEVLLQLSASATFHVFGREEQTLFEILPSSTLVMSTAPTDPLASNNSPEDSLNSAEPITVGPVVVNSLEAWKGLDSPGSFMLKVLMLSLMLGLTLKVLKRRKKISETNAMESAQLLLEELANEEPIDNNSNFGFGGG